MKALFRPNSPVAYAIVHYSDSFSARLYADIILAFERQLDSDNNILVTADTAKIAGLIGAMADIGHGDALIWVKE